MTESAMQGVGCKRDREGVKRSMACCLAGAPALSALQDEQRTKQEEVSTSAEQLGAQASTLVSLNLGFFGQGQHNDYKKPNCQQHDHNNTAIQILFSG